MWMEFKSLTTPTTATRTNARIKSAVSVVGLGYVGAVSVGCLAHRGHEVIGVDLSRSKVDAINAGRGTVVEAQLDQMISAGIEKELIEATGDLQDAVLRTDITFVCVGTPSLPTGEADLTALRAACATIGGALKAKNRYHVVVIRSTIPAGTTRTVIQPLLEAVSGKRVGADFGLCFHPEFLREGVAVADFFDPPKTVIGTYDKRSAATIRDLYDGISGPMIVTTLDAAEMVKVVDNTWHAVKVSFANEIGKLCQSMGVDSHSVMDIFVQDQKLNLSPYYLKPGFAFGGSCLPKDVRAMQSLAKSKAVSMPLVESLLVSNDHHLSHVRGLVKASGAKRIAFLGITFKAGTDDLRESPMLTLAGQLMNEQYDVRAFDQNVKSENLVLAQSYAKASDPAMQNALKLLPAKLAGSAQSLLDWADLVIVGHNSESVCSALRADHGKTAILDLVRLPADLRQSANYTGVCW